MSFHSLSYNFNCVIIQSVTIDEKTEAKIMPEILLARKISEKWKDEKGIISTKV